MALVVIPVGRLKEHVRQQDEVRLAAEGKSIREILDELNIPSPLVGAVLVNETLVTKEHVPQDGDQVKLISILGGG